MSVRLIEVSQLVAVYTAGGGVNGPFIALCSFVKTAVPDWIPNAAAANSR